MKNRLISSYDEENDIFVGKVDGRTGYVADYGVDDNIFLGIDKYNVPTSVFIPDASKVLNTPKSTLESDDVKIDIKCDEIYLTFSMCVEDMLIFSTICVNEFGIPKMNYLIDCNI